MKILFAIALFIPGVALADMQCKIEQPEELALDLKGVTTLVIEMGSDTLHVNGTPNADGVLRGRACASSDQRLALLSLKQERRGDRLQLSLKRARDAGKRVSFGFNYAYYDLSVDVPSSLAVELQMGSGDAFVHRVASLTTSLGSGDLEAGQIDGSLRISVGSGDVEADSIGALQLDSVGSGDVTVKGIAGAAQIGSVGSGDVTIHDANGAVDIGSLGSGDIVLKTITGRVELNRMGSGDLYVTDIDGDVVINHIGSGEVHPRNVKGKVIKPRS